MTKKEGWRCQPSFLRGIACNQARELPPGLPRMYLYLSLTAVPYAMTSAAPCITEDEP